ncbi:MAG: hypothetical protein ACI8UP_004401 [Porticoccaceae bacterium]|jgi:hypothetical protein
MERIQDASDGATINIVSPLDGCVLTTVAAGTALDTNHAIALLHVELLKMAAGATCLRYNVRTSCSNGRL